MALDPDISLRLVPLGNTQQAQANPLDTATTILNLQKGMNVFAAHQRASQIIASSPDFDSATKALASDPQVAGFAPELLGQYADFGIKVRQQRGLDLAQSGDAFTRIMQATMAGLNADSPEDARKRINTGIDAAMSTVPPELAKNIKPAVEAWRSTITAPGNTVQQMQHTVIAAGLGNGVTPAQFAPYLNGTQFRQEGEANVPVVVQGAQLGGGEGGKVIETGPTIYGAQAPGQVQTPGGPVPKIAIPPQPVGGANNELGVGVGQTTGAGAAGASAGGNGLGAPALGVPQGQIVLPPGARAGAVQPPTNAGATGATASQAPTGTSGFSVKFDPAVDKPPPTVSGGNPFQQSQQTTQSLNVANKMREDFQSPAALDKFNADNVALSQLHQLNVHLNSLASSGGFLTPGAEAAKRLGVANIVQTVANIFGGDVSPEFKKNIADATASQKLTLQFATNMAKATTRGPEAYNTISSFYSAVPGIENTPLASMFVSASIESQVKREIDLRNFQNDWLHYYPSLEGSTEAFAARPGTSERAYTQRALEPLGIKPDGSGFQSKEAVIDNARKGLITRDDALKILKKDPQFSKEIQQGQ